MMEDYKGEIWKDVKGFEGLYQVSNIGRVKKGSRLLTSWKDHRGNKCIYLTDSNGIRKGYKLKYLVAEHFVPNPNRYCYIKFKDGDKNHIEPENVEWVRKKKLKTDNEIGNLYGNYRLIGKRIRESDGEYFYTVECIYCGKKRDIRSFTRLPVCECKGNLSRYEDRVENLAGEIWKDVPGYDGLYKASNLGRIKTFRHGKIGVLHPYTQKKRYSFVHLHKNGKDTTFNVHRVIAQTFLPNPNNLPCVNHKNGIKTDNRVENLEWCTYQENELHSHRVLGKDNRRFKVEEMDILRENVKNGKYKSVKEIANEYNVSTGFVYNLLSNKIYRSETSEVISNLFTKIPLSKKEANDIRKQFNENNNITVEDLMLKYNKSRDSIKDILMNKTFIDKDYKAPMSILRVKNKLGDNVENLKQCVEQNNRDHMANDVKRKDSKFTKLKNTIENCDITKYLNKKINKLTILEEVESSKYKNRRVKCKCDCGRECEYPLYKVLTEQAVMCLRCTSHKKWHDNRNCKSKYTSRYTNLYYEHKPNAWKVEISNNNVKTYLGMYKTEKEALGVLNAFIVIHRLNNNIQEYQGESFILNNEQRKVQEEWEREYGRQQ